MKSFFLPTHRINPKTAINIIKRYNGLKDIPEKWSAALGIPVVPSGKKAIGPSLSIALNIMMTTVKPQPSGTREQ